MQIQVETSTGALLGREVDGVASFRGIPYAAPPVGALRFRAPAAVTPWTGVRECFAFAPAALQLQNRLAQLSATSEDCLYLNVWTPGRSGRRPVMVFVHGGGFVFGAGHEPTYDGAALARRGDVVVVTLNYRLSALGFLALGELLPGHALATNAGLLDVRAALAWVAREIAAFGGDPSCITLFGESAGAAATSALVAWPEARGSFARAISQSGGLRITSRASASAIAHELLGLLDVSVAAPERLWELSGQAIIDATTKLTAPGTWGVSTRAVRSHRPSFRFGPVGGADGLPEDLVAAVSGGANSVPLLVGTNRHEWRFFSQLSPEYAWGDEARTRAQLTAAYGEHTEALIAAYTPQPELLGHQLSDIADAITGDASFRMPSICLADAQSVHAPTYTYLLDYRCKRKQGSLGACHGIDLPLVFRTLDSPTGRYFVGDTPDALALCDQVSDAWVAFARSGVPSAAGLPAWPTYTAPTRATLQLAPQSQVLADPLADQRRAWSITGDHGSAAR